MDNYGLLELINKANEYLTKNPERMNKNEQKLFMQHLLENLTGESKFYYDVVFDFLLDIGCLKDTKRHETFAKYISKHHSPTTHKRVLDVGAGRMCHLSAVLSEKGFLVTAMDPNIRLSEKEAQSMNITINKNLFVCDKFKNGKKPTDIKDFDLIVGLEPCIGTEHIVRQAVKYNKPFEIVMCYEAHDALNGKKFNSPEDWFKYIKDISSDIEIVKVDGSYIAKRPEQIFEQSK